MNKRNVKKLATHLHGLRDTPKRFHWPTWSGYISDPNRSPDKITRVKHDCGTCACVGGWAVALFGYSWWRSQSVADRARSLLGLSEDQSRALFYPTNAPGLHSTWMGHSEDVPPQAAAMVLENLLETGEVDWSIIGPRICYDKFGQEVKR